MDWKLMKDELPPVEEGLRYCSIDCLFYCQGEGEVFVGYLMYSEDSEPTLKDPGANRIRRLSAAKYWSEINLPE